MTGSTGAKVASSGGLCELARKWGIYGPEQLGRRRRELGCGTPLISGLIPQQSISIVVGDSGVGKSPLLYQAAISVAAGLPFLGRAVSQGRVLYLDFENGLGDVEDLTARISRHLGLAGVPEDMLCWNYNDAPQNWTSEQLGSMVRDAQPIWTILDSLGAYSPEIEEKSSYVTRAFQEFRKISRAHNTAITGVHHLRKPSSKPLEAPPALEDNPHNWLLQARGSRALINSCDVRIGLDRASASSHAQEVALVLGGFGRVRGNLQTLFLGRVLDEDDEPLGYQQLSGRSLLFNPEQQAAYERLPDSFRFTEAQRLYRHGAQATTDFLKKCIGVGIMRKDGREYRKIEIVEQIGRQNEILPE